MITTAAIKFDYKPIQPTVLFSGERVTYTEFKPEVDIQQFIHCYWQLQTTELLTAPFKYRVIADGCIDIFFEAHLPKESYVMGFCNQFTEFTLNQTFNYIGVRFLPTRFPLLFKVNAKTLSNQSQPLKKVLPTTACFIKNEFNINMNEVQIKHKFDTYFRELISKADIHFDHRLDEAVQTIIANFGAVDIEKDLNTGISPRQLRRLFEYAIGDNPKSFSKVIRFQHMLNSKQSSKNSTYPTSIYDIGYYDQAHFIKEFKHFYGVTPGKIFGK